MEFLIITSTEDLASMNIRENLINSNQFHFKQENLKWHDNFLFILEDINLRVDKFTFLKEHQIYLGLTDIPLIHLNDLKLKNSNIDPDLLVFASRHRSETALKAFLTHLTGNWSDKADFGGNPTQLSIASALLFKAGFHSLKSQLDLPQFSEFSDFSLDVEVTHHGPTTLEKPLLFIELGSSENEWKLKNAGELVANAIINTILEYLKMKDDPEIEIGIGFGGTHYAPQFRKLIDEKKIAISFICPKYYIQELNEEMIAQMISNTFEKVDYFIIDWKGTNSQDKQHLFRILEQFEKPIRKTKDF
ncbi:MAG: D-aminoacyl-tRNA deacylase [Promethearchaeota archaeon]